MPGQRSLIEQGAQIRREHADGMRLSLLGECPAYIAFDGG